MRLARATIVCCLLGAAATADGPARAQDMLGGVDLSQPAYSRSEMTREQVVAALQAKTDAAPVVDLSNKSLNGLDLSGLDLSRVNLRAARLIKTKLAGAKLDRAILDQAWLIDADLTGASLVGAHLFAAQMQRIHADGADFSRSRIAGDLSFAVLRGAKFIEADMSADMKNQSMGLMRAVLRSAFAEGADFMTADLARADLRFLHAQGANFAGARLEGADASGATLTGVNWDGANTRELEIDSARVDAGAKTALQDARSVDRAHLE